jgi:hypothetical protein
MNVFGREMERDGGEGRNKPVVVSLGIAGDFSLSLRRLESYAGAF